MERQAYRITSRLFRSYSTVHGRPRAFSSTSSAAKTFAAPVPNRTVLSVTGSQASTFLNGMTASVVPSGDQEKWDQLGGGIYNVFLSAPGRVMYDVFIYPQLAATGAASDAQHGYLIEYDRRADPEPATGTQALPSLVSYLKRFILRSKVKVQDVANEWDVWQVWTDEKLSASMAIPDLGWRWGRSGAVEPLWGNASGSTFDISSTALVHGAQRLLDRRAPQMGVRILVPKGQTPVVDELVSSDHYTLHRIMQGVPEGRDDIPPLEAFPMDSNLDMMGGVDFRKGCYVGQELTVRTYHNGVIRKRIFPVQITPTSTSGPELEGISPHTPIHAIPVTSSTVGSPSRPRPRGTGKMLGSVGKYGLALLRLEHFEAAEKGTLALTAEGGSASTRTQWAIKPWRPDWWPRPLEEV